MEAARDVFLELLPAGCRLTVTKSWSNEPVGRDHLCQSCHYTAAAGHVGQPLIEIEAKTPAELVQRFEEELLPQLEASTWSSGSRFDEPVLPFRAVGQ